MGHGKLDVMCGQNSSQEMAPDQKKHVADLAEFRDQVVDLFKGVAYDGPPELFSMYCCLFLSEACLDYDPEYVHSHRAKLIAHREKFNAKFGIPPHPIKLLEAVCV
jgi:hypothetical protein